VTTLLNIQSSPRGDDSISRTLSRDFVTAWQTKHPAGQIIDRDLAKVALPHVDLPWISGIFVPPEQRSPDVKKVLALSDELIAELMAADEILIGAPMYNFTVPASLKAWIDLVVRPRVTHSGPPERKGLVTGKICTVIVASGGIYDEGLPSAASDFETGYLKRILGFIGITELEIIRAGGTAAVAFGPTTLNELTAQYRPAVIAAVR
jgi:FMN-dependent NADH-azoreductase